MKSLTYILSCPRRGLPRTKRAFVSCLFAWCLAIAPQTTTFALGTPAGVNVTNLATLSYNLGGGPIQLSAAANFQVDELIDLDLSALDVSPRTALPGDAGVALAFRLTNTGNGTETFQLAIDNLLAGNDFNPTATIPAAIYLDDGDENFNPALDTPYSFGLNDPALPADTNRVIYVLNDIPATANDGETGSSQLTAVATTGSGSAWTALGDGTGAGNTTAVLGASGGQAQVIGTYQATGLFLSLNKSYSVVDPDGTNDPIPGAIITYRIQASVMGTGILSNVVVTDPIPANTTYVTGSLSLNGAPLTDDPADDAGDFADTNANTITVLLGDMTNASPTQTIKFNVSIN